MTQRERLDRLMEYWRVQEDLEAILNVPDGMRVDKQYFKTVRWLKHRLSELEKLLSQKSA